MSRAKNVQTPGGAEAPASVPAALPADPGLPNAVDVDPRYLKGPVLSRQGWVIPDVAWQAANPAEFKAGPKAQG